MNRTLVLTLVRNRLSSPARMIALGVPALWTVLASAISHSLSGAGSLGGYFGIVCAAGAIGQDVSGGTLQLLLARPVTRPAYVISRWTGAALLAVLVCVVTVLAGVGLRAANGEMAGAAEIGRLLGQGSLDAIGAAAVVVMLSSLLSGLGDVAMLFGSYIGCAAAGTLAMRFGWTWLVIGSHELQRSLTPSVPLDELANGAPPWVPISIWVSTIAIALFVAIVRTNHRELSYASASA